MRPHLEPLLFATPKNFISWGVVCGRIPSCIALSSLQLLQFGSGAIWRFLRMWPFVWLRDWLARHVASCVEPFSSSVAQETDARSGAAEGCVRDSLTVAPLRAQCKMNKQGFSRSGVACLI